MAHPYTRLCMDAETLNCPMCGAAAASNASSCEHCGARLATVACPECFGMMFAGEKFCPHCGAKADRQLAEAQSKAQQCPRCQAAMDPITLGGVHVCECPKCEGIWTDTESLREICADLEKQSAVLGVPGPLASAGVVIEKQIRYVPCPVCNQLMNRINFAGFSGIIVDVCREHGTWFDRDELRRIVEFVRAGGMDQARQREIANLEEDRRLARIENSRLGKDHSFDYDEDGRHSGVWTLGQFLFDLFK